jgi:hypothetical protein
MNKLFAKLCLGFMIAAACASAEDAVITERLVEVKHLQVNQDLRNLFDTLGVHVSDRVGNYIALKGTKDAVSAAEEALHRMDIDKPEPGVEITGWLVVSTSTGTDGTDLPADLTSVAKQLKEAFGFANLRLLTSFVLRTRAGGTGQSSGLVDGDFYNFSANRVDVTGDAAGTHKVHLASVHLSCHKSDLHTDVDLNEGQKVVIGKTSMAYGSGTAPLILVLTARVITE